MKYNLTLKVGDSGDTCGSCWRLQRAPIALFPSLDNVHCLALSFKLPANNVSRELSYLFPWIASLLQYSIVALSDATEYLENENISHYTSEVLLLLITLYHLCSAHSICTIDFLTGFGRFPEMSGRFRKSIKKIAL